MDIWQHIDTTGGISMITDNRNLLKLAEDGCGLDDLDLLSARSALQHGEMTKGLYLPPRFITLGVGIRSTSLAGLQAIEAQYAAMLNPFRTTETAKSYLQVTRDSGRVRRIEERLIGYSSATTERIAGIYAARLLKFKCNNPFFFDPTPIVIEEALGTAGGLAFPLFDGINQLTFTATNIDAYVYPINGGHIETYPVITITGPGINPTLTNITTGKTLALTAGDGITLEAGDILTVDMAAGDVWFYDASAGTTTRATQYVAIGSKFWYLDVGSNTVRLQMTSANNGSIKLTYYNWYWWA